MKHLDMEATIDVSVEYEYRPGDRSRVTADQVQPPDRAELSNVRVFIDLPDSKGNSLRIDITRALTKREYDLICQECEEHAHE